LARSSPAPGLPPPKRAGEILVRVLNREHLPTHLLLGAGAVHLAQDHSRRQIAKNEAWRQVSISADFGQRYPVDLPEDAPVGSP
jgi:hypothetical protein